MKKTFYCCQKKKRKTRKNYLNFLIENTFTFLHIHFLNLTLGYAKGVGFSIQFEGKLFRLNFSEMF